MDDKAEIARPGEASPFTEAPRSTVSPFASLGDRLLAQAVDGLIALGIFFLLGMALAGRFGGMTAQGFELTGLPALVLMGILFAVMLVYFILLEAFFGVTLGKMVAEIRVTAQDGQRISIRASIIRNLMRIIDGIGFYLVGAFSVILTTRNVRLGDLAAGTIVVRCDTSRAVRAGTLVVALLFATGGIWGGSALRQAPTDTARPISATLALNVSPNHEPINPTTTFAPEVQTIHLAFKVSQAQPGSTLKAVWSAVNVGAAAPPNSQLVESTLTLPGPIPGTFRFTRGTQPWPVGDYKVDLYLNNQLVLTIPYKVAS